MNNAARIILVFFFFYIIPLPLFAEEENANHQNMEEITDLKKIAVNEQQRKYFISNTGQTIGLLCIPLLISGLSIYTREYLYSDNHSDNFMGAVNGSLTIGSVTGFTGFAIGASLGSGELSNRFFPGLIGGTIGFIAGVIIACIPNVRDTFNRYPVLYYTPTAISSAVAATSIIRIWL